MLAPSSSVVPVISEIWAEHRMYLPAPSCCSTWCWARRSSRSAAGGTAGPGGSSAPGSRSRFIQDGQDLLQNALYRNEIVMAAQREARAAEPPAHYNLGYALAYVERLPEAAAAFQRSIQCSTGRRLGPAGRGVLPHGRREPGDRVLLQGRGLRNNPSHPVDLANHLLADGRVDDCIAALRDGIRQYPGDEKLRKGPARGLHRQPRPGPRGPSLAGPPLHRSSVRATLVEVARTAGLASVVETLQSNP
ncbi:MAG: hypothetical protein U1F87_09195 [Kiritimatiellia bacterium]